MAFITLRQLLDHAAEHDYGVPAFNINNMEQLLAIMAAARRTASPVIVQASRGARSYAGDLMLRRMVEAAVETSPEIPVCLHQDHGNSAATCLSAIQQGFTSVMMDGSLLDDGKTAADFAYNVQVTREVVEHAHAVGVLGEAAAVLLGVRRLAGVAAQAVLVEQQLEDGIRAQAGVVGQVGLDQQRVALAEAPPLVIQQAPQQVAHGRCPPGIARSPSGRPP